MFTKILIWEGKLSIISPLVSKYFANATITVSDFYLHNTEIIGKSSATRDSLFNST